MTTYVGYGEQIVVVDTVCRTGSMAGKKPIEVEVVQMPWYFTQGRYSDKVVGLAQESLARNRDKWYEIY